MMTNTMELQEAVRLQLSFRSLNRFARIEANAYEPDLSWQESTLYSLLISNARTVSEITEVLEWNIAVVYEVLKALQHKKIVRAIPSRQIRFVAIKREVYDHE